MDGLKSVPFKTLHAGRWGLLVAGVCWSLWPIVRWGLLVTVACWSVGRVGRRGLLFAGAV